MFHDMPIARAAQLLGVMCSSGRIIPYQANGETYGAILHFQDHQVINRPHPSRIPPPPDIPDHNIINDLSRMDHGSITTGMERNGIGMDQGKEGNGKGEPEGEAVATLPAPMPKVEIKKMVRSKAPDPLKRISLNTETWAFEGIEDADLDNWKAAAPDVDIKRELNQLIAYAQTHEKWLRDRMKGGRWMVAIKAWMERAQGFSLTGGSGAGHLRNSDAPNPVDTVWMKVCAALDDYTYAPDNDERVIERLRSLPGVVAAVKSIGGPAYVHEALVGSVSDRTQIKRHFESAWRTVNA